MKFETTPPVRDSKLEVPRTGIHSKLDHMFEFFLKNVVVNVCVSVTICVLRLVVFQRVPFQAIYYECSNRVGTTNSFIFVVFDT